VLGLDLPVLMLAPFEASASAKLRLALTRIAAA
jgi:HPr kinase/phosphorylase